ncbi:uncharacterized protein LOC115443234 isoform X2 [Manduca sexta]|uniref:Uncharacterized protein n=1 Tax=Manduca sexta TaxID=7130 RepID=A0A921Z3P9_MANSE|nr:uncharacterized protein LOC115443234 isoform X2 [Manduca sexta]KAG6449717.1 hypothetical protein O3G_MSEX006167 [Manduca sexta]
MSPPKVNKEKFRLLDLTSDDDSEDLQLEIIPSRKKKITRRERNRVTTQTPSEPNLGTEVQCALRWAVRGTLLLWLLMLTWICAALYDQVTTMKIDIARISTSSESVGDALQICHTTAKELQANTSDLNTRLAKLEHEHQELVLRVKQVAGDLTAVSDKLVATPNLADTPRRLAELQRAVADFGSQMNGYDGSLNSAKKQALTAVSGVEEVRNLLHQIDARTNETIANVTENVKRDEQIKNDITALNNTLEAKLVALQTRIEEISKPTSTAAPTVATPPTTSSTTASTTTPSTTTTPPPPPGPAKPFLLQ